MADLYGSATANLYNNIIYGNTALLRGGDLLVNLGESGTTANIFNNDFTNLGVWSTQR